MVGLAFQVHLIIVAFVMGIAILAPIAEWLGLRPGWERWEWIAHGLSSAVIRLFAFGATWAVFALVLIFALYPRLFGVLTGVFFWPLVVVAGLWFVMSISAYLYAETWTWLGARQRKGWHIALGCVFAGSTFAFVSIITFLSSFQLTPSDPTGWLSAALNASWPTEVLHRHVGNLSYGALLVACYAGARIVLPIRRNGIDVARYDWLADTALLLGLGLALLQPIGGWFYARQVQLASPGAYDLMMIGANAWMWLVQGFFFGAVLFLGNLYILSAVRRGRPERSSVAWMRRSLLAVGILALLLIVPKEWPLGQMMPWKYISLAGLVLFSALSLVLYLRARPSFVWGSGGRLPALTLAAAGIALVALMVTMGVIREGARGGDLIYGRMGRDQVQQIESP